MYVAIVVLPLLGAIIAGVIALVGARNRHPGADPSPPHDDHAAPLVPEDHAHGAPIPESAHAEPELAEPAAGSQAAELITTTLLAISWVLSCFAFVDVGIRGHEARIPLFNFIVSGDLKVDWALRIDPLTAVMLVVVTTVSGLVHLYSIGYMADDPYKPRFFSYLSFFTFAMLMLVTADNLAQLFFGWEGVGLSSYLLIGFWFHKPEANAAAIKAFVVNRIGDFGFALGIFAVFLLTGSIDFDTIFAQAPALAGKSFHYLGFNADALTVICLLLFMGAMGKSAQFLLHTWLPDAMEGPTPVSALIHAATMVTAGVFMVARLSPLFELAPTAAAFVTFIGATTAIFAATVGLVQNDIKRIIAYSTCSQLGYMFVAMGVGAYSVGHVPPVHPRLLQGAVVPRLRLGDPRHASRAGHPQNGRPVAENSVHLCDHAGRHAGADRISLHRRLLLQGRDHRGGRRRQQFDGGLRLRHDGRRRGADLVLFVAAHFQDLSRRAARSPSLRGGARERQGDAGSARHPGGRLDRRRLVVFSAFSPVTAPRNSFASR